MNAGRKFILLTAGWVEGMFKRRRPLKKLLLMVLAAMLIFSVWTFNKTVRLTLYEMAEVRVIQMATESINNAVRAKVAEQDMRYQDIIEIHKDSRGKIVLMQANAMQINKIATETTLAVQAALVRLQEHAFYIPLGQITGIDILSNLGPGIKVGVIPMGTVRVDVEDRFDQAGINQTRHSIYLNYVTDVRIVVPLRSGQASVSTRVPVMESIIVGEVPSTFVSLPDGLFGAGINR
jgi:sporulation protein YunB